MFVSVHPDDDEEDKDELCGNPMLTLMQILISSCADECVSHLQAAAAGAYLSLSLCLSFPLSISLYFFPSLHLSFAFILSFHLCFLPSISFFPSLYLSFAFLPSFSLPFCPLVSLCIFLSVSISLPLLLRKSPFIMYLTFFHHVALF